MCCLANQKVNTWSPWQRWRHKFESLGKFQGVLHSGRAFNIWWWDIFVHMQVQVDLLKSFTCLSHGKLYLNACVPPTKNIIVQGETCHLCFGSISSERSQGNCTWSKNRKATKMAQITFLKSRDVLRKIVLPGKVLCILKGMCNDFHWLTELISICKIPVG